MMIKTVVYYVLRVLPEESLASVQDADLIRALASLSVEQVRSSNPQRAGPYVRLFSDF